MDTTATSYNNSLNLYNSNNRCVQQQTQAQYQQQYPALNQGQFYGSSSHLNHQAELMWEKQHHQQQQPEQHKPSYIVPDEEYPTIPQNFRNTYNSYYTTATDNITRNIKTKDKSPLFMCSAEEHSKVTTNNKYQNNSCKNESFLSLIKEDSNKSLIIADDEGCCGEEDDDEEEEEEEDQDDNHAKKRSINSKPNVVEKKRHRRESHNAVERRRRNNINDNIRNLGALLPENMCQGKLNKGTILKGSVMYINMLNDQLSKYKERLEHLKYEAAALNPSLLNQTHQ